METNIYSHIQLEFDKSLPMWIDSKSPVLVAIKTSILDYLDSLLVDFIESGDFFVSNKAKAYKLNDFGINLNETLSGEVFKDKFRYLFRRGAEAVIPELQMLLDSTSSTVLKYSQDIDSPFVLEDADNISIQKSSDIVSGWIADVTYPGIDSDSYPDSEDKNDFIFSEEYFLYVSLKNESELSDDDIVEEIRHYYLPALIPSIFNIRK